MRKEEEEKEKEEEKEEEEALDHFLCLWERKEDLGVRNCP